MFYLYAFSVIYHVWKLFTKIRNVQIGPLFHNLLNWDPLTGPVPLLGGAVPHFWDAIPQIVELFHFLWNCSIKSGTVPLCFGLLGYCPNLLLVEWYSILSVIFFYEDVMWFVIGCFLLNSLVWINGNSTLWQRLKLFLFGRNLENLRLNKLWTALIALYLNKLEDE